MAQAPDDAHRARGMVKRRVTQSRPWPRVHKCSLTIQMYIVQSVRGRKEIFTMTKEEAIKEFVSRDLNAVPQEWVRIVAESKQEYPALPMWGTMWIVDENFIGEKLIAHSRVMVSDVTELDVNDMNEKAKEAYHKACYGEEYDYAAFEEYIDEEMAGERCVLDKDGKTTALFVYEIGDEYVIGVNGAGWDFYHGVWDKLYDLLDLHWHDQEEK
jgi:hypothetical protein